jgi:RNA polymerase-binding transcription factor DksA
MATRKHVVRDKETAASAPHPSENAAKNANVANLELDRAAHVVELERLHEILREIPETTAEEGDPTVFEREKTLVVIRQVEDHIANIDHALETARRGGYGICERCGQPIEPERLRILPETRVCVKCKTQMEGRAHHRAW